ncbi:DNA repair protein RadA-like isoform X2 [Zingiber officinale]|uniref:DNA repair protein RadA-like isoform X2 n=1 Tax=Zingiber officinale TaxID=94328 RepID=UPI001C4D308E|nr:DNA repair protein RadA-like isoform X2 [Zingiber officinale]
MQSFRSHFLRRKLLVLSGSKSFAGARSLISSFAGARPLISSPVHFRSSSFHSSDRRWEEESRDSPASSVGVEVHKFSTYVDPLEGKIVTMQVADERDDNGGEAEVSINTVAAAKVSSGSSSQELNSQETDENKQNSLSYAGVKRKSGKTKSTWVCENCGDIQAQWWGTCPNCQVVGKFKRFVESEVSKSRGAEISEALVSSWLPQESRISTPISLAEVTSGTDQSEWRIPLEGHFGLEFCRVLGGGLVPGSLVLIGGDPGVGKSTLLLQIAAILARGFNHGGPAPVVYASGEESIEQIRNRAQRMSITTKDLYLYSNTDIEDILEKITKLSPRALIVDSIQTVYLKGVTGSAGNVMQIKECTSALLRFAKQTNIPVFLSGHVTKTGEIAGPRILEHIVDAVFYMEGDRHTSYRLVRSVKNRFGSTDEIKEKKRFSKGRR